MKKLKKLAELFTPHTLYIVGGAVRDELLNISIKDIDITSSATPEQIVSILSGTEYSCKVVNARLGCVHIYSGNSVYEHTTFRAESCYGAHTPLDSQFVTDILTDASRRDLTINSIYKNIITGELFDPYNGTKDIRNGIIRAVRLDTFSDDGLRILRMIRFACMLDFRISRSTLNAAKSQRHCLSHISNTRKIDELSKILSYDIYSALRYIDRLHIYPYLFTLSVNAPRYNMLKGYIGNPLLAMIYVLYADNIMDIDIYIDNTIGNNGLCYPRRTIADIRRKMHALTSLDMPTNEWVRAYYDEIPDILSLLRRIDSDMYDNVISRYNEIDMSNIPVKISQLNINGDEIINKHKDIPKRQISKILSHLLMLCYDNPELNNTRTLHKIIKETKWN